MSNKINTLWKVVHINIPSWSYCPVADGYAVAYTVPFIYSPGTLKESAGLLVLEVYSGYVLLRHALTQCNTLNMKGYGKDHPVLERLTSFYIINRDYACDAV